MTNEETKACPSCSHPIERKNFWAVMKRCRQCKRLCCPTCMSMGICVDCYIEDRKREEVSLYHEEKRVAVTHALAALQL